MMYLALSSLVLLCLAVSPQSFQFPQVDVRVLNEQKSLLEGLTCQTEPVDILNPPYFEYSCPHDASQEYRDSVYQQLRMTEAQLVAHIRSFITGGRLERKLMRSAHNKWGFVIYRCTYDSDDDWERLMAKLRARSPESLANYPPLVRKTAALTVFEDKADLDGADVNHVRKRFHQWLNDEPWREQPVGYQKEHHSLRYEICLMIDKESLYSILNGPEGMIGMPFEDNTGLGYVIAVRVSRRDREKPIDELPALETLDDEDDAAAGNWLRMEFFSLPARWYELLDDNGWYHERKQWPNIAIG